MSAFLSTIFCITLSTVQTLKSDSKPIALKITEQWHHWNPNPNQWPNVKWNSSQWPSATWRPPVSSYPFPPRPTNPGDRPTIYPPLPDYTVLWPKPPIQPGQTDSPPSDIISTDATTTTTTSSTTTTTTRPFTTEKKPFQTRPTVPQTRPTVPQTKPPPPPTQEEDSSKITVKSCGLSHIPHELNGNKIVSGKVAKSGEFPWQVILKISTSKGNMQCGGAILNSK